MTVEVIPVHGIPEVESGADLAALITEAAGPEAIRDGDVVVITQKVVSKAEGRVVPEGEGKATWVPRETRRVVARRGELVIAETHHGFVCANAGVDASNVPDATLSLLPEDPDRSAARIRDGLRRRTGNEAGVVITDTFGRPWRRGQVNVAIGCAGLAPLIDLRGTKDALGRLLEATVIAVADEVAAASGLAMGKAEGIPVAVVRGLAELGPERPARDLVRPPEEDLFRASPLLSISSRRTIREFGEGPVPREAVIEAVAAALTAPVPHGSRTKTRPWRWVILDREGGRRAFLSTLAAVWERDLRGDGLPEERIARRLRRSDALLGAAPVLAVPFLSLETADRYPDPRRREAERDMFLLATGAAVQNFMLALHAQGLGSAWVSSTLFCKEEAAEALGLAPAWLAMGAVAVGALPSKPPPDRAPVDPTDHLKLG
jgi:coenzyme F420-0:L-glutamate ligase / coenzyme F420-1:gamma-L-glutamate ligase